MQVVLILLLILAVLLVIFTLQNSVEITVHLFFWDIANVPLVLVLLGCIIIGYLVAVIYFYPRLWKVKKEYRKILKFNKELQEMQNLDQPKKMNVPEDSHIEGIKLDKDDEENSFFKD
jgi:uncharacterized integral membrane protein